MMPTIQFLVLYVSGLAEPNKDIWSRLEKGKDRFLQKWRIGFATSLCYWPFVNGAMYALINPLYYNIYADCFGLIFAAIMSFIAYNNEIGSVRKIKESNHVSPPAKSANSAK